MDAPRVMEEAESTYDLTHLTSITRCKSMWADFDRIVEAARERRFSPTEIRTATAVIVVTLMFKSTQCPSAITGLVLEEVH